MKSIYKNFFLYFLIITTLCQACIKIKTNKDIPSAKNGIIDLKKWDFEKDGPVDLSGEWKFKWMEDDPSYLSNDYNDLKWENFVVPGFWNRKNNIKYGYAIFRLKIKNLNNKNHLSIF